MIPSVLAWQVRETLLDYLRTTFALRDAALEQALFTFLGHPEHGLFQGPFVDLRLPFRTAGDGAEIPLEVRPPFVPYAHQIKAFGRLSSAGGRQPHSTLVTTGTGSGKTECFLYPVLDHCLRQSGRPGVKAILLYPMNALAADQARRFARELWDDERLRGHVSAGLYVGGDGKHGAADREHLIDRREILRQAPPDILLTNYKMLDFLLLRPEDRKLWRHNGADTLRYLVLDELHTYDGAQGSDVACLLRRLKASLGVAEGSLCCVGTSATIGSGGEAAAGELVEFASQVFGEQVPAGAVVTEDRMDDNEALGFVADLFDMPGDADAQRLEPESYTSLQEWLSVQAQLWTGDPDTEPMAVGRRLRRHVFLRCLLHAQRGGVQSWTDLDAGLCRFEPDFAGLAPAVRSLALQSFLGLISHARNSSGRPFLTVQVQLWVRELRRLVRKVSAGDDYCFQWADAADPAQEDRWLPMVYCRECGGSGLGAVQREGESRLQDALGEIGRAYYETRRTARYVQLRADEATLVRRRLCPKTLMLRELGEGVEDETGELLPVQVHAKRAEKGRRRFLAHCPDCGADAALSMLGSRAASLLSVAINHVFLSPYNDDKKLLAFTDSVQDASHRAGFFGARTYRFNLRTAIQAVVDDAPGDLKLSELGEGLLDWWSKRLEPAELLATLTPPDLTRLPEYEAFVEKRGRGTHRALRNRLRKRLSWEVAMEYGHRSQFGRTLERSRCSTAAPQESRIEEAAAALALELRETAGPDFARIDEATVRHFLEGLLHRVRARGGIVHELLERYVREEGAWFHLTKGRNPLMSPFGSRSILPRFLHDRPAKNVFDKVFSSPRADSWYRDWAVRCLGVGDASRRINDVYRAALARLEAVAVLRGMPSGAGRAFGLEADALVVTRQLERVVCPRCGFAATLAQPMAERWRGRMCPRYRCEGLLEGEPARGGSYYAKFYRSGQVQRVFAEEHTGLLQREDRESLEERFSAGDDPGAPNLLVCTPTLELGVDVGDLSAVTLCSVPPATANYLQRVGRAGRKTGNAFCFTQALARPHDLYFQAEPPEMIAGEVRPPGCFLDAPEMLKRQLVAHAMDRWAAQETTITHLPPRAQFCLGASAAKRFPGRLIAYCDQHAPEIVQSFFGIFGDTLGAESRQRLLSFAQGDALGAAIRTAFDAMGREKDELRTLGQRISRRLAELGATANLAEEEQKEKAELEDSRRVVRRLITELLAKYPLNVLTDAGVLPNYAFPEPGVTLKSVIRRDDGGRGGGKKGGGKAVKAAKGGKPAKGKRYQHYEYVRPASSAIQELAPFNTFYAEGRRVRINEVDVGSKTRPLTERWRLCEACHHSERMLDDTPVAAVCPRCADGSWSDSGQERMLVRFVRARSLASRLESVSGDDSDDRERASYQLLDLIDVGQETLRGAWLIPELPFGFELLHDLTLRQLNFGTPDTTDSMLRVADTKVASGGFEVCLGCGRVKRPEAKPQDELRHAPYCVYYKGKQAAKIERVFLYRQVQSEAIRVLLPVAMVDVESTLASFKAALHLGLRRKFRGNPGHLLMKTVFEPVGGDSSLKRRFLVLYDGVPGGTGYLSELWRSGGFLDVLELALQAMTSCTCNQDGRRDGCYRCLYAYQRQRDLPLISRRRARDMLAGILARRDALASVATLSDVELDSRVESELEARFLRVLRDHADARDGWSWMEVPQGGSKVAHLRTGGASWRIEAQVPLGPSEGVGIACRPDFLIHPRGEALGAGVRPVAVFCDGFRYHACPDKEQARIADDISKRQAILESGGFLVWSVAWKDLDIFEGTPEVGGPPTLLTAKAPKLAQTFQAVGAVLPRDIGAQDSMRTLVELLQLPDAQQWTKTVRALLTAMVAVREQLTDFSVTRLAHDLQAEPAHFAPRSLETTKGPTVSLTAFRELPGSAVLTQIPRVAIAAGQLQRHLVVLRIFDEHPMRQRVDFERSWRAALGAWNLLQFHGAESVRVLSSELHAFDPQAPLLQLALAAAEPTSAGGPAPTEALVQPEQENTGGDLGELLRLASEACHPLIQAVRSAGLPLPEPLEEILGADGRPVAHAELRWPQQRVAVLLCEDAADLPACRRAGWTAFEVDADPSDVISAIRPA